MASNAECAHSATQYADEAPERDNDVSRGMSHVFVVRLQDPLIVFRTKPITVFVISLLVL